MANGKRLKEIVSYVMSRNKSKDTKPEIIARKYLFSRGLRFRKNDKRYPGRPDIVLPNSFSFIRKVFIGRKTSKLVLSFSRLALSLLAQTFKQLTP